MASPSPTGQRRQANYANWGRPRPHHVVAIGGLRLSVDPEQGPLLEMAHLPEAGFRLGKTPADDLMSANPN